MRFIAVDPGANFTGIAVLENKTGKFLFHGEYDDPVDAWLRISWNYDSVLNDDLVVLENFIGGGQRDEYVTKTIKTVGYIEHHCRESGYHVVLVNPQVRLSNVKNVPDEITGKDEIAAAAHALSARERWPRVPN